MTNTYSNTMPIFFEIGCSFLNNNPRLTFSVNKEEGDINGNYLPTFKFKQTSDSYKIWLNTCIMSIDYCLPFNVIESEPPIDATNLIPQ